MSPEVVTGQGSPAAPLPRHPSSSSPEGQAREAEKSLPEGRESPGGSEGERVASVAPTPAHVGRWGQSPLGLRSETRWARWAGSCWGCSCAVGWARRGARGPTAAGPSTPRGSRSWGRWGGRTRPAPGQRGRDGAGGAGGGGAADTPQCRSRPARRAQSHRGRPQSGACLSFPTHPRALAGECP